MNVLLISPAAPESFWSYRHALRFISKKAVLPPLGLLTVAAMLPKEWKLRLIDLNASRLTDADIEWADYVLISAMIVHADSVRRVVARCNAKSKVVIAGGPLFTTGHERFPEIEHFVLGEAEAIMPSLVGDMSSRVLRRQYQAPDRPDITQTPVPRWDLIDFDDYSTMPVQLSRGCPFDCEFCDIITMYGRIPRVKTPTQMICELDSLLDAGWTGSVFIVDDNFIGNKAKAAAILRELVVWRKRRGAKTTFLTEASLNLADSPDLLDLMVRAGFKRVFIGIETPNEESLAECSKVQNCGRDLQQAITTIQNAGLEVMGGFIVGFDNDGPGIFERQWRFIQEAGVVTAMVGLLTALPQTRLYTRLQKEGRILCDSPGTNDGVLNFAPRLDREMLLDGYRALVKRLYAPKDYYQRAVTFLREYRPKPPHVRPTFGEVAALFRSFWVLGVRNRGRRAFWKYLAQAIVYHRRAFAEAVDLAIRGHHFRKVADRL
ncbi:MAG: B12-binding domain-containing radical SAM protein [Phycisphaerales bacterium]|nr:B12-binding domain-containing radical SAM protein [Phycisphaerales bacterium]